MTDSNVPAGFTMIDATGGFEKLIGPFYAKEEPDGASVRLRLDDRHYNSHGVTHGGLIATFADLLCGAAVAFKAGVTAMVTIDLKLDFAQAPRAGDWLEGRAEAYQLGGQIGRAQGYIRDSEKIVAHVSGVFRIWREPRSSSPKPQTPP